MPPVGSWRLTADNLPTPQSSLVSQEADFRRDGPRRPIRARHDRSAKPALRGPGGRRSSAGLVVAWPSLCELIITSKVARTVGGEIPASIRARANKIVDQHLYYQNPDFGMQVIGLVARRLGDGIGRLEARIAMQPTYRDQADALEAP